MPESAKPVWLGRTDIYEGFQIPDEDFAIALKVIRTVRNICLGPEFFDGSGAVILSHAHAKLVELALMCESTCEPTRKQEQK